MFKFYLKKIIVYHFILAFFASISLNSNAAKYYVSSSGNDTNSGTNENSPWRTLTRVNNFYKLYPGDSILFNRGDEWSGTIRINASGTEQKPIYYGAYGSGPKPKFYGSELITGEWALHSENIYKTSFSKTNVEQVYFNNKRLNPARYPKSGYLPISTVNSPTRFSSNQLNSNIDYKGAKILIRDESWSLSTKTITSSSYQTINIQSATNYRISQGEGFFLVDKLEFLTQAGEWYYDTTEKLLYLWTPDGDSPANHNIRVSLFDNGVNVVSKDFIILSDLELLHNKSDAFKISNSNFVSVINSEVYLPGSTGILINEGTTNAYITNNIIEGANDYGIKAYGTKNTFTNNTIRNIKLLENISTMNTDIHSGVGIFIEKAPFSEIKYNVIENTGSAAIQFYTSPNTIIENNYIKNTMLTINDGGGIYCWSISEDDPGSENSVITGNIVENTFGNTEGTNSNLKQGHGIYIDDRVHHITVTNNTIIASSYVGIFLHNTKNIEVRGNTIFDSGRGIYVTYSFNASNNIIKNNIILNSKNAVTPSIEGAHLAGVNSSYTSVALIDSNTYIAKSRENPFRNDNPLFSGNLSFLQWKRITGWDANSSFDGTPLAQGESEKIFFNETLKTKKINLGNLAFRDVHGKPISGIIKLEPFTSKILIGKNFDKINQGPSVLDQSFNFIAPKYLNDSIGKVIATDPDSAQALYFSIYGGNESGWFDIDSLTGEIFAKIDIQTSKDVFVDLMVSVRDSSAHALSDSAKVSIKITGFDTSPPIITKFDIPPIYVSLTIPITSFTATDDVAVVGYKLTETSTPPSAADDNWADLPPTKFEFSKEGPLTLYAWVKDSTGNISASIFDVTLIKLPDMSPVFSEYKFEEPEGLIVIDSNNSNDGTIYSEEIRVNGVKGNGLTLNGSNYINLGQSFGENVENEISLSTWIKPDASDENVQGIIVHGGLNSNTFALFIYPESKSIGFKTTGTTNELVKIDNINELWDGNWHHLLVTYNGIEKTIFIDNVVVSKISATGKIESGWGYNLLIGAGTDEITPTLLYKGLIDETRIYNYALISDEIRELYNTVNSIYKKIYTNEFITMCAGDEYFGWTESGQYERILKRKLEENSEADSTVTTYLTVNQGYQHFDEATICEGENFQFGIQNLSSSGEYIEIFNTINGCDSTVILTLNVIPKYVTNVRADICEGDYYTFGNQNLSTSGEYTEVFKAITGCDSMIVLTLNVIPKYRINKRIDICEGDIYIFGTQNLSTSGEYTEVFQSINGCDSIVTISLNVNSGYNITEDITITYVDNYMGWTEEGTYQRELLSLTGCDSTVITNLKVLQSLTQNIKLETGWNILSSYLIPTNATIDSVMETLRLEGKLVKVQDEANNSYEENELLNGWINNIGDYTITEGYRIRVNTNCDFDIIGKKIELPLDISLKKGINLISFPANASINAMQVIEPLINSGILLKVQDERGNAIENWGNFGWINSIGDFHAGEGYIVNVNEMGILTINDISEKSTQLTDAISKPEHFGVNYIGNGFNHMNINVVGLNESQLKAGDEIAVFDRNNCVGAIKLNENHLNSNRVSINASASEANFNNGFLEGNSIDFRIWSLETNQELKVMPEIIEGNTIFERQASVFIKLKKESNSTKNIEIFPNPASNILYIRFSSLPENGAKIVLMDVTGKQIFNTEVHSTIEKINTENLSPGIYLIKTSIQNQNRTHKIIII